MYSITVGSVSLLLLLVLLTETRGIVSRTSRGSVGRALNLSAISLLDSG